MDDPDDDHNISIDLIIDSTQCNKYGNSDLNW